MQVLKEYKSWQNEYIFDMGSKLVGTDRVFTAVNGKHMHPDTTNDILQKVLQKYDLPKIIFHELRHTCASILNSKGVDAKTISERLGHADASITLNTYTHTFDRSKEQCANVFDNLYKSSITLENC